MMTTRANVRRSSLYAVAVFMGAALSGAGVLRASDFKVQGTYAFHAVIGPGLGSSLGIVNVDSGGAFTGYALLNLPSADGKGRTLVRIPTAGIITVNPDGTGQLMFSGVPEITEDFVILKAKRSGGAKLALEVFLQRQQPSGLLGMGYEVTYVMTRLPDDDED